MQKAILFDNDSDGEKYTATVVLENTIGIRGDKGTAIDLFREELEAMIELIDEHRKKATP